MISQNIRWLQNSELQELVYRNSIEECDEGVVCYLNLLIDNKTGEFLELCSKRAFREGADCHVIAVKFKSPLDIAPPLTLSLVFPDDISSNKIKEIVEKSFQDYNKASAKK